MKKTISFAVIHFTIAFTVAYVLTGDILIGSLIALIEPAVNTVAFFFHEKTWQRFGKQRSLEAKTTSFAVVHFSVAFTVAYLLSGELLTGGVIAMIEPVFNTVAFYFHENVWRKREIRTARHAHHCHPVMA
ncbi:DUF2061 domain-containing protein [Parasalinivibrio latis]|uniref:DUF2061 domain-containing protein n=1 Tax=Parasalinivibrio latis TaxID=2952610 RepID=UPI0030E00C3B